MNLTKNWFKAAGVRAIKTVAQTAVAMIGTSALIADVNWAVVISGSLLAGVLSILTSIAGLPEVKEDNTTITNVAYDGTVDGETERDDSVNEVERGTKNGASFNHTAAQKE